MFWIWRNLRHLFWGLFPEWDRCLAHPCNLCFNTQFLNFQAATFILAKYVNRTCCRLVIPETMESFLYSDSMVVFSVPVQRWNFIELTWFPFSVLDQPSKVFIMVTGLTIEFSFDYGFLRISSTANILRRWGGGWGGGCGTNQHTGYRNIFISYLECPYFDITKEK